MTLQEHRWALGRAQRATKWILGNAVHCRQNKKNRHAHAHTPTNMTSEEWTAEEKRGERRGEERRGEERMGRDGGGESRGEEGR